MLQISGTVTVGNGSEIHNHDRQYRSTLKHVINPENDVVELRPAEGIRLQYGGSEFIDPGKNSGKNQRLEDWQKTQDAVRELQYKKTPHLTFLKEIKSPPMTSKLPLPPPST